MKPSRHRAGRLPALRLRESARPRALSLVEELEPRILYSADTAVLLQPDGAVPPAELRSLDMYAMPAPALEIASGTPGATAAAAEVAPSPAQAVVGGAENASQSNAAAPLDAPDPQLDATSACAPRHEIVFVDARVADAGALEADIAAQSDATRRIEVVEIAANSDGVAQIGALLAQRRDIGAVHIVSHGADGAVQLGRSILDFDTLRAEATRIKAWGNAFTADGDLLLYGCDVAQLADGRALVDALARLTGADVAASTDLTGQALRGGNWALEYANGPIESDSALSQSMQASWAGTLAIAQDNVSSSSVDNAAGLTWSHTVGSGSNGLLLVEVALNKGGETVSSVTYGGSALTYLASDSHGMIDTEVWYMKAPAAGTANVVVTATASAAITAGAINYFGVDQTSPLGAPVTANGKVNPPSPSVTVASATGELVIAAAGVHQGTASIVGGGQTEWWNQTANTGGAAVWGATSTEAGAASVTMDWSVSISGGGGEYAIVGVAIKPAANSPPVNNVPGAQSTNEDTAKVFSSGNGNQISIADPDAGSTEQVTLSATNGSLTLAGITGLTFSAGDGSADATMTFQGTVADINTALNGLTYSPTANYNGAASLTITTIDSGVISLNIDASLEGRYAFDNPGDLGNDTSPSGANDGTPANGPAANTDPTRGAVLGFDGINDYVQVSGRYGNPTNITLAAWVNLTAADTGGAEIISIGDSIALRADNGGATGVTGFMYDGTSWVSLTSGTYIAGTGWHHLAYTFDDTGNVNKLYIDGNLAATATTTSSISYTRGANTQIGRHGNGGTSFDFNGKMDEVRVYSRALGAAEVAELAADLVLQDTDSVAITVNAVNDAPVITNGATVALASTDEDTTSSATTVSTILTSASWADVDTGAVKGIAVTSVAGNGTWQYSTDGTTWTAFGAVTSTNALLLTSTSQVRYIPDGLNGETATFGFKAWDQTTGTASVNGTPGYATTAGSGGTSAFSSNSATSSIIVTSVNDAPTITNGATVTLAATDEDTTSSATTVSTLLTGASWADVDTGAVKGIAVTSVTGNGAWQYSTDGVTWTGFGAVTSTNALLLTSTSQVRYIPDGLNGETATFGFKAWDQTIGTASVNGTPGYATTAVSGGTTAFSGNSATSSLTVTSVNDAPTITNGATVTLAATDEDTISSGTTVASILTSATWADVDSGAVKGIAVTSVTGNGAWQYSTDGVTWTGFGAVTSTNALLLTSTSQVRYIPDGLNGETATFGFKAWDQTSGTASVNGTPAYATTASSGGTTAFSTNSATSSITVTSVNDAPTITNGATVTLAATDEDTISSGTTVASILTSATWTDVDSGAVKGIAVTSVTGNGAWQYSTDGVTWTGFGAVTSTNALLLTSTSQVRYLPDGLNGETASFGFKAWDQTTGTGSVNGTPGYATTAGSGGTSTFSGNSATASITVTSVNDAPVFVSAGNFTSITEDQTTNGGQLVSSLISGTDVDTGALAGIAVYSQTPGNGTWQYSTNGGGSWTAVGAVAGNSALLLRSTDYMRFVPDALNADSASVSFYAWDQTTGSAGSKVDVTTRGGTTAFSSSGGASSITVSALNDAPSITNGATVTLSSTNEDTTSSGTAVASILTSATWADVDSGAVKGIAVTSVSGNGTWQYSTDGATWTGFGAVTSTNALLLTSTSQVRYIPDGLNGETATFGFKAWDQTTGTASVNGTPGYATTASSGGTSAFSGNSATSSITVTSVNDAPTITNGATVILTSTNEDTTSSGTTVSTLLTGATWADVDTGAVKGIAVTSVSGNGSWEYSTDGVTWTAFGAVTSTNALLLTSTSQVRYIPDGLNGETATFGFKAWDQTTGTPSVNGAPGYATTAVSGGTTAFSTNSATSSLTVAAVNDAPTITNGATVALAATDEDTTSSATTVSTLLTGASWADVDTGAVNGVAVTSVAGNGTWQYSTDGVTWTVFGAVTSTNALLLTSTSQVRYLPDGLNGESASFGFKAWDQTTGTASVNGTPGYATTAVSGGTTAFSGNSATSSITVTSVNDAPTVTNGATVTLTSTNEDTTSSGTLVSAILTSASWADVDSGAVNGIAVTSVSGNGTWQYSTDATTWTGFGAVSGANALLLTSTSQVRYLPDSLNGETASFGFKAWDQTSGTASVNGTPGYAATASSGGTSAFSSNSATSSLTVTAVNDAPTITNGATVTLSSTSEDTTSSGTAVASILTAATWADVDSGAVKGIAVTSVTGNGTWQYSTDGVTWTGFGAVSGANALLLTSTSQVRYIPDGLNGETASFGFKAWDQTTGTASVNGAPGYATTAVSGGTTAFSSNSATSSITVTLVNDAPTITNGATVTLAATDEDTTSSGTTVSSILTSASWADVDSGAVKGVAVTSMTGNGTWQYSTDGVTWTGFGAVSGASALLLTSTSQVRYIPDGLNGETASFGFKAWDQTSGTASVNGTPGYATTAVSGGTTAFSGNSATSSITVTSVNDAPTVTNGATVTLTSTNEDTTSSGTLVSAILTSASWADVDSGAVKGIAVTSVTGNGAWQYSNDGVTWTAFGAVTSTNALLLTSTSQVRYTPDGLNGETASFGFTAWDQTSGTASVNGTPGYATTAVSGGTTAFSGNSATSSITVTPLNDAPVFVSAGNFTSITEDQTTNGGQLVSSLFTGTDVDSGAVGGIALYSQTSGNGTWQYSTNGGGTWNAVGAVAGNSALLLGSTDSLRFVPDALNADSASVSFHVWDQTAGVSGSKVDVSTRGGTSAFSTAGGSSSISVTAVNDAPTITNGATATLAGTDEDSASSGTTVASILTGVSWADLDNGAAGGIAVTSVTGRGTWQYSTDGVTWTGFGAVSAGNALLLTSTSQVRYIPDSANGETAGFGFKAWDQTTGSASLNGVPGYATSASGGGTSAFSGNSATTSITVTSVNDAPSGAGKTVSLPQGGSYAFTAADFGFTDPVDAPANALAGVRIATLPGAGALTDNGVAVVQGQLVSVADISTGQLRFTPAANAAGADYASFAFQVEDDGGTANGGVNLDATPRTLGLSVVALAPPAGSGATDPGPVIAIVRAPEPATISAVAGPTTLEAAPASTGAAKSAQRGAQGALPDGLANVFVFSATVSGTTRSSELAGQIVTASPVAPQRFSPLLAADAIAQGSETFKMLLAKFRLSDASAPQVEHALRGLSILNVAASAAQGDKQEQASLASFTATGAIELSGIAMSAGFVAWAIRGGGLLASLAASLPTWRNLDPLPVLAPQDDKPKWAGDEDEKARREERAVAQLFSARPQAGHEGVMS